MVKPWGVSKLTSLSTRRPRRRWLASATVGMVVCVALLGLETISLASRAYSQPIDVSTTLLYSGQGTFDVQFRLSSTVGAIGAHVALLPGSLAPRVSKVMVFYDPAFHVRFANGVDVVGLGTRIAAYLSRFAPAVPVDFVDAMSLPSELNESSHAALVVFGYDTLPDSVFSAHVSFLRGWIEGGGILVWAGGPLAYFEGHVNSSGVFVHEDLGWSGQTDLLGFPLEDSIGNPATRSSGPLVSGNETLLGESLGVSYAGTADGANVSELSAHNGTDVGFDSQPVGAESPRTSVAFIPLGKGGVFYFGGAIWGTGFGTVPDADASLSGDIALLLGTGYEPSRGPADSENVTINYLGSTSAVLGVSASYPHMTGLVTSRLGPTYLFQWARQLV